MTFFKIVTIAAKLIAVTSCVAITPALLVALLAPKAPVTAPIAPKAPVTAPIVAKSPVVTPIVVKAPKAPVTAPKSSTLIVPTGCNMAIGESFTQAEINEFCAPTPTANDITKQDRKMLDAHIERLKNR